MWSQRLEDLSAFKRVLARSYGSTLPALISSKLPGG
jgi:hypothetical protein